MKTLLLMRHAKSSWKDMELPDIERPLKKSGKKAAEKVGNHLEKKGLVPEIILCSTAVRARETAEELTDEIDFEGDVLFLDELYMAEPDKIIKSIVEHGGDHASVMVIGHNPGLESTLQNMVHDVDSLPTATVAQLVFNIESWDKLPKASGLLVSLWRPKMDD